MHRGSNDTKLQLEESIREPIYFGHLFWWSTLLVILYPMLIKRAWEHSMTTCLASIPPQFLHQILWNLKPISSLCELPPQGILSSVSLFLYIHLSFSPLLFFPFGDMHATPWFSLVVVLATPRVRGKQKLHIGWIKFT